MIKLFPTYILSKKKNSKKKRTGFPTVYSILYFSIKVHNKLEIFLSLVIYIDAFYKIAFLNLSIMYSENYGPSFQDLDE